MSRSRNRLAGTLAALLLGVPSAWACELEARQVAERTWIVEGAREEVASANCGLIANLGFIVTPRGVILIDSGPSRTMGEALTTLIADITPQPVRWIFNTHHHPDHVFGNHAFPDAEILALQGTVDAMQRDAEAFQRNLTRLLGASFADTRLRLPDRVIEPGDHDFDGYSLRLLAYRGHSGADLVILDTTTGVLFAGDLVFYQRTATTPHTPGLAVWIEELETLAEQPFQVVVPGHGPVDGGAEAIHQTRDYLGWLDQHLRHHAAKGHTANQVREAPVPERFGNLALLDYELTRSLTHLYGAYEQRWLWGEE